MIAVLAANSSRLDALITTASCKPKPPEMEAICEMKRSLCVDLKSGVSMLIDNRLSSGAVTSIVPMTANIAQRVVLRSGRRMVGLNWLMLSNPEKASQAAENPTRRLFVGISAPGERLVIARRHWLGDKSATEKAITSRSTTKAVTAIKSAAVALSRMPMTFKTARANRPVQAKITMWSSRECSTLAI